MYSQITREYFTELWIFLSMQNHKYSFLENKYKDNENALYFIEAWH